MLRFLAEKFPLACASDEFFFFPHYKSPDQNWKSWDNFTEDSVAETCNYLSSFESAIGKYHNLKINWYEPQGKPWTLISGASPGELDQTFLSAEAEREGGLNRTDKSDIRLLSCFSRTLREQLSEYKTWKKQPSFYLTLAGFGLEQALASKNPDAIHDRASGLPAFLDQARINLSGIPEIYADIARKMLLDISEFIHSLVSEVPELIFALPALERFNDSMSRQIQPGEQSILPVEAYERSLKDHLAMDLDLKEIEEILDNEYRETHHQLEQLARKLSSRKRKDVITVNWTDTYRNLPEPDIKAINKTILYSSEIKSLRLHCCNQGLIHDKIDERCQVNVSSLPSYLSAIRSASSYSISPDSPVTGGTFFVLENLQSDDQYQEDLREYRMLTAHETWPGHHLLDACRLNLVRSTRRFLEQPLFYEGWACFAEELCGMTGYFSSPEDRLIRLKRRFWRAARGKADIGLNTGKMNILSAGEYLKRAGVPVEQALSSVRKYTLNPGYQLCYTLGLVKFLELFKYHSQLSLPGFVKKVLTNGETFQFI